MVRRSASCRNSPGMMFQFLVGSCVGTHVPRLPACMCRLRQKIAVQTAIEIYFLGVEGRLSFFLSAACPPSPSSRPSVVRPSVRLPPTPPQKQQETSGAPRNMEKTVADFADKGVRQELSYYRRLPPPPVPVSPHPRFALAGLSLRLVLMLLRSLVCLFAPPSPSPRRPACKGVEDND